MISKEQAEQVAAPYLAKGENTIVHVNQHGLIWINNEKDRMEQYFAVKKEKFWVFEKDTVSKEDIKTKSKKDK